MGTGKEATGTPTLTFKGLGKINGVIRLFEDSECSTVIGSPYSAKTSTMQITAPNQTSFYKTMYESSIT